MAAVFTAFDRPTYRCLIPDHLADLVCFPSAVIDHLQKGSFCASLSKNMGHTVALDECHEMMINKDAKFAVVRPSKELMHTISNFLPFRAQCMKNLKHHLFLHRDEESLLPVGRSHEKIAEQNLQVMLMLMDEEGMLPTESANVGLQNRLCSIAATPEQAHDLLTFREIGQAEFEADVKHRILHMPSTNAPRRQKRLQTFSTTKATKRKPKKLDQENKLIQMCMKKQLAM